MNKKKILIICLIAVAAVVIALIVYNALAVDIKIDSVRKQLEERVDSLRRSVSLNGSNPLIPGHEDDQILVQAGLEYKKSLAENELEYFNNMVNIYNNIKNDPDMTEQKNELKEWILNYKIKNK